MKITADDLSRSYRSMSDGELLAMDQGELTDMARKVLEAEMERRGLTHLDPSAPPAPIEVDVEGYVEGEDGAEPWVSAGIFQFAEQARAYLPSLEEADIPAELEENADLIWVGSNVFAAARVVVPASFAEDAQIVIENHARREELLAHEHADASTMAAFARYEDGVFKPHDAVDWEEGTEVEVRRRR
jgi:hypothetical protein